MKSKSWPTCPRRPIKSRQGAHENMFPLNFTEISVWGGKARVFVLSHCVYPRKLLMCRPEVVAVTGVRKYSVDVSMTELKLVVQVVFLLACKNSRYLCNSLEE